MNFLSHPGVLVTICLVWIVVFSILLLLRFVIRRWFDPVSKLVERERAYLRYRKNVKKAKRKLLTEKISDDDLIGGLIREVNDDINR